MKIEEMIPQQWTPPCNSQCTHKYASLMQIPYLTYHILDSCRESICKKGCDADGETWDECLGECDEICYKDPVLKDQKWSSYIDRSPGSASYSEECFRACVSGCGYKFEIPEEEVNHVHSRPPKAPAEEKPPPNPAVDESQPPNASKPAPDVVADSSA